MQTRHSWQADNAAFSSMSESSGTRIPSSRPTDRPLVREATELTRQLCLAHTLHPTPIISTTLQGKSRKSVHPEHPLLSGERGRKQTRQEGGLGQQQAGEGTNAPTRSDPPGLAALPQLRPGHKGQATPRSTAHSRPASPGLPGPGSDAPSPAEPQSRDRSPAQLTDTALSINA